DRVHSLRSPSRKPRAGRRPGFLRAGDAIPRAVPASLRGELALDRSDPGDRLSLARGAPRGGRDHAGQTVRGGGAATPREPGPERVSEGGRDRRGDGSPRLPNPFAPRVAPAGIDRRTVG